MAKQFQPETEEQRKSRELVENIANNISALTKGVQGLLNGPLNKKALIVLIAASSGQPMNRVTEIISAMENLEKDWLKK